MTAGGVAPIPGVTVMGDRVPLSLVMEVLPHFTSLHSSLDTRPARRSMKQEVPAHFGEERALPGGWGDF